MNASARPPGDPAEEQGHAHERWHAGAGEDVAASFERARRQSADLARHLNAGYPDTVLFLARFAGGVPGATSAKVVSADPLGLVLEVHSAAGHNEVQISFRSWAEDSDIRGRIAELLRTTRQGVALARAPWTGLERQLGMHETGHGTG